MNKRLEAATAALRDACREFLNNYDRDTLHDALIEVRKMSGVGNAKLRAAIAAVKVEFESSELNGALDNITSTARGLVN